MGGPKYATPVPAEEQVGKEVVETTTETTFEIEETSSEPTNTEE